MASIEAGRSPKNQGRPARDGEVGVLKVSAVSWGKFLPEENKALLPDDAAEPELAVRAGDLLISRANTTDLVGAVVYVEHDYPNLMLADKTLRLVPTSDVSAKYLLYALRTATARDFFAKNATGTSDSMRNISQAKIRTVPIPLPPLAEQRRIVERVEALMAQARTAREALAPLPALVRRLRQTVLAAAFSGRLSEREPSDEPAGELLERIRAERALLCGRRGRNEERGLPEDLPELPEGWAWTMVGEMADISGGIQKTPARQPKTNHYPYLRVANVLRGRLDLSEIQRFELTLAELERWRLKPGDALIVEGNGSLTEIGRCAIWQGEIDDCVHQNHLIRVRLRSDVVPEYFGYFLNSDLGRNLITTVASSTSGLYTLSVSKIERVVFPLAPLAEQRRIVKRVEALMAQADIIEQAVAAVSGRLAAVEQAVLARAFRGELVEQENGDELEGTLLEQISADQETRKQL